MIPSKKTGVSGPKRVIDWFDLPDEGPDDALLRQMQAGWRLLAERPAVGGVVLVTDGKELALGRVDGQGKLVVDGAMMVPTHWLPLPVPPEPVVAKGGQSIFRNRNAFRRY